MDLTQATARKASSLIPNLKSLADQKLGVFVDSATIGESLRKSDFFTLRLISYKESPSFAFLRSSIENPHSELAKISQVKVESQNGKTVGIAIEDKHVLGSGFSYIDENINPAAKSVFKKDIVTENEIAQVSLVFLQKALNNENGPHLFVTNNRLLLANASWFETNVPGGELNIVDPSEALTRMDLFAKTRDIYYVSANRAIVNEGYWYLISFRCKIPHFHFDSGNVLEALSYRVRFVLMSLDRIGVQYYLGANNDTMDNTIYHFNYLISLLSGIFDCLAIETGVRLQLQFKDRQIPWKTSLFRKTGNDFKRALKEKNVDLADHIQTYDPFIELIHQLRQTVIHREGVAKGIVAVRLGSARYQSNFIKVPQNMSELVERFEAKGKGEFSQFRWGAFVSPYHFAKALAQALVAFSDKYLELLGFSNYVQIAKEDLIEQFEKGRLGF